GITLNYDPENRLTGASGYTYTYDGDGNRVKKSNGTTGTIYWYMTPGIVGESDLSGNLTAEYVFFDSERVARKSTNGVFYYFSDHLKTASVITDSAGNVKAESDYYPWGGELQFSNNDSNHYKFTGKERDSETQLDYFGARFYSNELGRWVSADWSAEPVPVPYANLDNPQSLNLYGYAGNHPATVADVNGHFVLQSNIQCYFTCKKKQIDDADTEFMIRMTLSVITAALAVRNFFANNKNTPLPPPPPPGQSTPADPNQQTPPSANDPNNRRYEPSPKHGSQQSGNASAAPKDGPGTLNNSIQYKPTSTARVGVDPVNNEIVQFKETNPGAGNYHGYVSTWSEL